MQFIIIFQSLWWEASWINFRPRIVRCWTVVSNIQAIEEAQSTVIDSIDNFHWYGTGIYWCWLYTGLRIMCIGYSSNWLCYDLLWCRQCHLFHYLWFYYEVHWKVSIVALISFNLMLILLYNCLDFPLLYLELSFTWQFSATYSSGVQIQISRWFSF